MIISLTYKVSSRTFLHSLRTSALMGEMADIYDLDRNKAMRVGLLHDSAKDLQSTELLSLAQEARIPIRHACERLPTYLHGPVSAYLVRKEFGIKEHLILNAISTHTCHGEVPKPHAVFAWCLRIVDVLAPSRKIWLGMNKLRQVAYSGKIEEAALLLSGWLIKYFHRQGIPIHPNIKKNYQALYTRLNVKDSFFERW